MRHLSARRLAALLAVLAVAIFASSAYAGDTTGQIVRDVAADGHVDGHYTNAQLRAALASPLLAQYGGAGGVAGVQAALTHKTPPGTGHNNGQLPFTGSDIALFLAIGGVLVVAGVALRRFGRNTPPAS